MSEASPTDDDVGTKDPERRLLNAVAYKFRDRHLLLEALTHRSFVNEAEGPDTRDNERFEFLGDAVLDLVVSTELMERFPKAREGELSRMRAAIVHEAGLAALARRIHLGSALRLGRGEERSGGRERDSILSDAFEALVAAVYLDGGYERAAEVLRPLLDLEAGLRLAATDPKTELQQRYQAGRKLTPRYRLVGAEGPEHDKRFVVEVLVDEAVVGTGEGRSKKQAEQRAAANVLASWDGSGSAC